MERPTVVLYDRSCPLCRVELHRLKAADRRGRIRLVDISSPGFDVERWGFPLSVLSAALHARTPAGDWLVGMPALRHAYTRAGFGWVIAPTGWPLLSPLADALYRRFAPSRQRVSRWLGLRAGLPLCAGDRCGLRSTQWGGDGNG